MKSRIMVMLTICLAIMVSGCSLLDMDRSGSRYTPANLKSFCQVGTTIVLSESHMPLNQAKTLKVNIERVQTFLTETETTNLNCLQQFVNNLPSNYQFVGATIVDMIQRFIRKAVDDVRADHDRAVEFALAGLSGAHNAVVDYISKLESKQ